jgi:hypothetical protein
MLVENICLNDHRRTWLAQIAGQGDDNDVTPLHI